MVTIYNREFSSIDTPEKAYVLGLIYSDGFIGKHKTRYLHTIVLQDSDITLLYRIKEIFPFYKIRKHTANSHRLECCVKDCYFDLYNNGVLERKSTENKNKLRFPNIDSSLYHHFIRGYFDGDGSVYKQKVGNTKIEIGSTCFYIITDMIKILYDNHITVNIRCKYAGEDCRKNDFYILYTSSDKISKQFAAYIYENCNELYLKRKYDKLLYIPDYSRKEKLICPNCGNNDTTYLGTRKALNHTMQRGMCKICNKRFSIKLTAPLSSNIQSGGDELLEG